MKIKNAIAVLLCMLMPVMAWADMTDSQIIQFVSEQQQQGVSQGEIVRQLLAKGVTPQQLQRLKAKYDKGQVAGMGSKGAEASGASAASRTRANNGTGRNGQKAASAASSTATTSTQALNHNRLVGSKIGRVDETDEDFLRMESTLNSFMPDSATLLMGRYQVEQPAKGREVFGRAMFRNENVSFEPNMNIATPGNYVLGAGDEVFIDIYGASQLTISGTITPDGFLTIEDFGPVQLSGLSVDQANKRVANKLGSSYQDSEIVLTVGQTRTIQVNVMGEVLTPGTYTLSAFATVFHALYSAGGVSDIGSLRSIKVYRNGRLLTSVDVYDYILNGRLSGDTRLQDNDVILVAPYEALINMAGKVKRPMFYEMKTGETVNKALEYAGGFASDAYTRSMRLIRKQGGEYSIYNIDETNRDSFRLLDGDSIAVDSMLTRYRNMVEVKGAVFRPGMYQLGGSVTTVKGLLLYAEGVTEDAFTARAVLHRMRADRTLEVIAVDVDGILNGTAPDIALLNEDVLFVPSLQEMRDGQTLTIHGEVYYPGVYVFAANETLEDLILQAGGLRETASTVKVDVARRISDPKAAEVNERRSLTFSFALKDGFVIDGEPGFVLQPFDEVYVRRSPGYSDLVNVKVEGEVLFSGTYTLASQKERLSDIIKSAGGITPQAYIRGARLERRLTQEEKERMRDMLQNSLGDSLTLVQRLKTNTYSIGIDLEKAVERPGTDADIVLQEGDRIVVPRYSNTVKINGEVMYPNSVTYKRGKSASYYISQAGGYANTAKKRRAYIVYQNGQVAEVRDGAKPEPGCEIVVPAKPERKNAMQNTSMWVSIGSSIATMAAVLITAIK